MTRDKRDVRIRLSPNPTMCSSFVGKQRVLWNELPAHALSATLPQGMSPSGGGRGFLLSDAELSILEN
jgi:hypothetical protein